MFGGNEVSDTVRDGFGFAAARAGEDEHSTIGGGYCFALLGVKAGEKIH